LSSHPFNEQSATHQYLEEAYQESERRFQAVWEAASDAMALSTPDGIVLAANPAYYQLYGYTPEEVIGHNFSLIFPKEQREWAQELYNYIFQSPTIGPPIETTIVRADGTERIVESSYSFLTKNGARTAMLSIVRDITERKKTEEALRESERKLNLALEIAQLGTWDWDVVSNTVRLSANLESALGLAPRTAAASETFLNLVHPEDRPLVTELAKCALEEGTDYQLEFRIIRSDGIMQWIATQGEVLYNEEGKPVRMIGVSMDVTRQKEVG
jgi:PAS domain S-box-containing protein